MLTRLTVIEAFFGSTETTRMIKYIRDWSSVILKVNKWAYQYIRSLKVR